MSEKELERILETESDERVVARAIRKYLQSAQPVAGLL